jgi:L-amino acid N-acyltransferase YncA
MKGITYIYNHYVENSLVTEDQLPITEDNIKHMFDSARQDNFPFIVAIKGKMPAPSQERYSRSKVATLPQNEIVIGFGYAEAWAWGLNYSRQGRSRFTACLQFYVHPEYTRKKVGQSLLDKLTQCLSYGYGYVSESFL